MLFEGFTLLTPSRLCPTSLVRQTKKNMHLTWALIGRGFTKLHLEVSALRKSSITSVGLLDCTFHLASRPFPKPPPFS